MDGGIGCIPGVEKRFPTPPTRSTPEQDAGARWQSGCAPRLTFSVVRKLTDNEITVEYKLTIAGDKLAGKSAGECGGEKREFDIEAKRDKKDK
jgi:hypothetical protein